MRVVDVVWHRLRNAEGADNFIVPVAVADALDRIRSQRLNNVIVFDISREIRRVCLIGYGDQIANRRENARRGVHADNDVQGDDRKHQ